MDFRVSKSRLLAPRVPQVHNVAHLGVHPCGQ